MTFEEQTRRELAASYRLLNHFGWDDLIYSHISVKIPNTEYFLTNSFGLSFNEITASNLVKINIHGEVIGDGNINPAGFIIHSAIHQARPEIGGIIHTHTKEGIAVSCDKEGLWPISQRSIGIINQLGYHNYQGIVIEEDEKESIVKDLDKNNYLILKNHGLLTVGFNIGHAFMNMWRLQRACEIQVLCNRDRVDFLPIHIIKESKERIAKIRKSLSDKQTPWHVLLRMVEKLYPDYKN
jgi:ribulose-5-phosphate 4-epimerase/fuculose-1-phosphate aldolase